MAEAPPGEPSEQRYMLIKSNPTITVKGLRVHLVCSEKQHSYYAQLQYWTVSFTGSVAVNTLHLITLDTSWIH